MNLPALPFQGILYVSIFASLLSWVYLWCVKYSKINNSQISNFILIQYSLDICCISVLIILTGGVTSNLRFVYLGVILLSALNLEKTSIYVMTVFSLSFYYLSLNFTPILFSRNDRWLALFELTPQIQSAMLAQFVFCFLTALLSGFMQTAYRTSYRELVEKEQRIRSLIMIRKEIVESLPSGLMTCDPDVHVNFVNQMGCKLLGGISESPVELNAWVLFDLEPRQYQSELDPHLLRLERHLAVGNVKKVFGVSFKAITTESGKRGFLIIFQDLTKIKILEGEKRFADKMSAIGKMAAGVAHEIRNPLASISGSIQVLREMVPEDEGAGALATIILKETRRLNDIISQFLAYARPGSPPDLKPMSLSNCIKEFASLNKNDPNFSNLKLELALNEDEAVILGDQAKLIQVFWNLFRNGVQACRESPRIELACFCENTDVCFSIKDNGIGMTEDQLKDLFTPFQSFTQEGTGLGMSIVYDIVKMHQGKIDVTSKTQVGTCVRIRFPKYKE